MKISRLIFSLLITLIASSSSLFAASFTYFEFTSSPTSWVGGGTSGYITPDDQHTFIAFRNFQNGVSLSTTEWHLEFASADELALVPGEYLNATRFPFNDNLGVNTNGLNFSGNGRGNNELSGFFNVLEAIYAPDGSVISFAADFTQYDEKQESWWNVGSIRFNSSVGASVPETGATIVLTFLGFGVIVTARAFRARLAAPSEE